MGEAINIGVHVFLFITLYFEVFLVLTFLEGTPFKPSEFRARAPKRFPSVSIIVPCSNEENTVTRTLLSLLDLNYPKEKLQIIVVDDGSTDATWKVLQRFKRRKNIDLFHKENGGKHTALNLGLEHARGELIGCLDADSFVAPHALREIVKTFEDPEVMAVTPAIQPTDPKNLIQLIQRAEYALSSFIRKVFAHLNGIFITPGPFSIFRREVFERLGNYKAAHNTEDLEFGLRMQKNHFKIANSPTAHVFTNTPRTIRALHRQRLRWTYGYLKNSIEYRHMFFKREYGNLGMLVLPIATIAIFGALYFAFVLVLDLISKLLKKVVEVQTIGVQMPNVDLNFDWFYLPTGSSIFLIITIIGLTVLLTIWGKRLVEQPISWPTDIAAYVLFYGFLAPWWLARAVFNAARSHQSSWTAERQMR